MDGVGTPLVTPFKNNGDIDEESLRSLVDWVAERGVDFVVPCGSTGEAELMTLQERATVIDTVCESSSVPVIAGTGHPGYRETITQTDRAAESGADAAMVATPFYYHHEKETLEKYYLEIADESEIPIYVYNIPGHTDVSLSPETVESLATHTNIQGIKDSSGEMMNLQQIIEKTDDGFEVVTGSDNLFQYSLCAGADGGILGLTNVVPEVMGEVYHLYEEGDLEEALSLNNSLIPLLQEIIENPVPRLKASTRVRGAPAGYSRRPHREVNDETRRKLDTAVEILLQNV